MLTPIIISFFAFVLIFIFYHFKYGKPEDLASFRIALKMITLFAFWAFFIYMNFINLWYNTYSSQQGSVKQRVYLQQESGTDFEYFSIFMRHKQLVQTAEKLHYNWQVYYPSRYYKVLPNYLYKASFLDTIVISFDSTKYDRMLLLTHRDSVFAASIALDFQKNPILLFSSDLKSIKMNDIRMDFSYEISQIILLITAILAAFYHILKITALRIQTLHKYFFYLLIMAWSGTNIYQILQPILKYFFILA